jgi:hypothetical protein
MVGGEALGTHSANPIPITIYPGRGTSSAQSEERPQRSLRKVLSAGSGYALVGPLGVVEGRAHRSADHDWRSSGPSKDLTPSATVNFQLQSDGKPYESTFCKVRLEWSASSPGELHPEVLPENSQSRRHVKIDTYSFVYWA